MQLKFQNSLCVFFIVCYIQLKPESIVRNHFLLFVILQNIYPIANYSTGESSERIQGANIVV